MDFGKLEDNEGRNKGGTGLGLSICKQIIEQMGGSVEVKSKLGRGTDFIINLKIKTKVARVELDSSQKTVMKPLLEDITSVEKKPKLKLFLKMIEARPSNDDFQSLVRLESLSRKANEFKKIASQIYEDQYNMPECIFIKNNSNPHGIQQI